MCGLQLVQLRDKHTKSFLDSKTLTVQKMFRYKTFASNVFSLQSNDIPIFVMNKTIISVVDGTCTRTLICCKNVFSSSIYTVAPALPFWNTLTVTVSSTVQYYFFYQNPVVNHFQLSRPFSCNGILSIRKQLQRAEPFYISFSWPREALNYSVQSLYNPYLLLYSRATFRPTSAYYC